MVRGARIAVGAALLAAAGAVALFTPSKPPASAPASTPVPVRAAVEAPAVPAVPSGARLSVAVLPFANRSGDPGQEYFADGITEYVISDLSRISGSVVIARNSTQGYGADADVRTVGRELQVNYALRGSVEQQGGRYRVEAALYDTRSGERVWAETYDVDRAHALAIQTEITGQIANRLQLVLVDAESRRSGGDRPADLDSVDVTLRGQSVFNRGNTKENMTEAGALFRKALEIDDTNAAALAGLAHVHQRFASQSGWDPDPAQRQKDGLGAAERAVAVDPGSAYAHFVHGILLSGVGRVKEADAAFERSLAANLNFAPAHAFGGYNKMFLGRAEEGEPAVALALRLSPKDPSVSIWCFFAGMALLHAGNDPGAVEWLRRSVAHNPSYVTGQIWLAAALALSGDEAAAREAVATTLRLSPGFKPQDARKSLQRRSDDPVFREQLDRVYQGLLRAGFSEQ